VLVNKAELIDRVAGSVGVEKTKAEGVLDAFFNTVTASVKRGDKVAWPGFGSFSMSRRAARTGRNPRTGEPVAIKASKAMKFTASSTLKSELNSKGTATKAATKSASRKSAAKKSTAKKASAKKTSKSPRKR
jgi:DNA-binding protein HU-beta